MENDFGTNERLLGLLYAYLALVRTLQVNGTLDMDRLLVQVNGAQARLGALGENGAQAALQSIAENLTGF